MGAFVRPIFLAALLPLVLASPVAANDACIAAIKNGVPNPETVQIKDVKVYKNVKEDLDELLRINLAYANRHLSEEAKIKRQCLVVDRNIDSPQYQRCVSENLSSKTKRGLERIEILKTLAKSIVEGNPEVTVLRYRYWYLWTMGNTVTAFRLCVVRPSGVFLVSVDWREQILVDDD